jgi:hypothetical protein
MMGCDRAQRKGQAAPSAHAMMHMQEADLIEAGLLPAA